MSKDYTKPFDSRLTYLDLVGGKGNVYIPISGTAGSNANSFYMSIETLNEKEEEFKKAGKHNEWKELKRKQQEIIKAHNSNYLNSVQQSLMNPYAMIHLSGGINSSGKTTLIDKSNERPWYEVETNNNDDIGYSKTPTTTKIIAWGNTDEKNRTPYLFQDFVFCKWWNKIPNNRLITLRRYSNPVLDNLNTPIDNTVDEKGHNVDLQSFPPMATALTYFGEETGNSLNSILKFSTGMPWGETKADIWDLTSQKTPTTNEQMSGALGAIGLSFGNEMAKVLNGLSVMKGDFNKNGAIEKNGLPPDPYKDGPYQNRIQGPVNRIDTVKKRDAGLKFAMDGLKIKFDYVARPIGGINSKAVMLDILANFMVLGSASAVFFGGAHRNRIQGVRFPAGKVNAIKEMYKGNILGENGAISQYGNDLASFYNESGGAGGILSTMWDAAKGIMGDLLKSLGNPLGMNSESSTKEGKALSGNIQAAVAEKMKTGMTIPYIQGMRALLTGEPVGEWHLTIGNPMNPIAMIGNLICTNIEVEIDEDAGLGPDDFPLGWTITVSLEHGMARDRDSIESMFNFGNGRIYELPDKFIGSADKQTKVDDQTQKPVQNGKIVPATTYVKTPIDNNGRTIELSNGKATDRKKDIKFSMTENPTHINNRTPRVATNAFIAKKALK